MTTFDKNSLPDLAMREQAAELLMTHAKLCTQCDAAAEDEGVSEAQYNEMVEQADKVWDQYNDLPIAACTERSDGTPMICMLSGVPILVTDQIFLHEDAEEAVLRVALGFALFEYPADDEDEQEAAE